MSDRKRPTTRENQFTYLAPAGMGNVLRDMAARAKLSVNAYITQCVFDIKPQRRSRRSTLGEQLAGRLLGRMGRVSDQLASVEEIIEDQADPAGQIEQIYLMIRECRDLLLDIRAALFELLGRKP